MTDKIKSFGYANKVKTNIWHEQATAENPYVADTCRLHGYNMLDLAAKKSFTEVLFLLLKGDLPTPEQTQLLDTLMVSFINLGPRHPATRTAMLAGASKALTSHILPVGLITLGGDRGGSAEVEKTTQFILEHYQQPVSALLSSITVTSAEMSQGDIYPFPGVGSHFGSKYKVFQDHAKYLLTLAGSGHAMSWMNELIEGLSHNAIGWLPCGLFASVMVDLGIAPREAGAMFQLICAPGILAHGLEQTHKPLSHMPLLEDDQYEHTT